MRQILLLAVVAIPTKRIAAQNTVVMPDGAATITAAELARHAVVLASDSLRARAVPSPGLERTARYITNQFEQFGLHVQRQRYPIPGRSWLDKVRAQVALTITRMVRGKEIVKENGYTLEQEVGASFDTAAYFLTFDAAAPMRDPATTRRTLLITGRHTAASLRQAELTNAQVLFVPPIGQDSATLASVVEQLRAQSHGLVVLSAADSAAFDARLQVARRVPLRRIDSYLREAADTSWAAEVWPAAFAGALAVAGVDLAGARTVTIPSVRPLPFVEVHLLPWDDSAKVDTATAPNVIGRLEGTESDVDLRPLVISAHMDHTGFRAGSSDSLAAGTDRDASEIAGLLALAQAMTRSGIRPRRTVIFLASSGGAVAGKDDWGTNYFINSSWGSKWPRISSNLALEQLSRPADDTLFVAGTLDVQLPRSAAWVAAEHPELRLTLIEESGTRGPAAERWVERSTFSRLWIPSIAINSGHLLTDTAATELTERDSMLLQNAEREVRALRFVYHLVEDLTTARGSIGWSANGRQRRQHQSSEP